MISRSSLRRCPHGLAVIIYTYWDSVYLIAVKNHGNIIAKHAALFRGWSVVARKNAAIVKTEVTVRHTFSEKIAALIVRVRRLGVEVFMLGRGLVILGCVGYLAHINKKRTPN